MRSPAGRRWEARRRATRCMVGKVLGLDSHDYPEQERLLMQSPILYRRNTSNRARLSAAFGDAGTGGPDTRIARGHRYPGPGHEGRHPSMMFHGSPGIVDA